MVVSFEFWYKYAYNKNKLKQKQSCPSEELIGSKSAPCGIGWLFTDYQTIILLKRLPKRSRRHFLFAMFFWNAPELDCQKN